MIDSKSEVQQTPSKEFECPEQMKSNGHTNNNIALKKLGTIYPKKFVRS